MTGRRLQKVEEDELQDVRCQDLPLRTWRFSAKETEILRPFGHEPLETHGVSNHAPSFTMKATISGLKLKKVMVGGHNWSNSCEIGEELT